ncbi:LysR substrate-binding domain-containing protein [uncultured Sphingobium sp.]|uniref:LysR substrate-binding domain-containing protein n=1 Tax=uncultured Sphingobium sp. TaxID=316087 RepID=UPI002601F09F|nr:LysR substrate-binding domain-containing protein [uncultured Sphingobium sp.]
MDLWALNLRHLDAMARIVELGTINAAARKVNLTQSAITQAIARLEAQLGVSLFYRKAQGMSPTEPALLLAPRVEAAMRQIGSTHVTMARMRALLALADAGSYAGAAEATQLSMPSLHRAVTDLSLASRRKLVERRGRTLAFTEAGLRTVRAFRLARADLLAGLSEVEALLGRETRVITIGAMPLSRARILPAAVVRFARSWPAIKIAIVEGSRSELLEPLRDGAIDFTLGALRDPMVEPDLLQEPLFEDRPQVFARRGHPLENARPDLAALARHEFLLPPTGTPLRDLWDEGFRGVGLDPPRVTLETGSVMMIRQMLLETDRLTLLSPDQLSAEIAAGMVVPVLTPQSGPVRSIGITMRAEWRPTSAQEAFLKTLRALSC